MRLFLFYVLLGSNIIGGEKKNKNRDLKKEELPDIKLEE